MVDNSITCASIVLAEDVEPLKSSMAHGDVKGGVINK